MQNLFASILLRGLKKSHEVEIMYFGRASDFLMMTSERIVIPNEPMTLQQLLNRLRARGERWVEELADCHVVCTVNQSSASLMDKVEGGDEIGIFSRKSVLER